MAVIKPLPITFKSRVIGGKMPDVDKELFNFLLDQCEGKVITLALDYYVQKRSNIQLSYYWPVIVEYVLEGLIDIGYRRETLSPQLVHDFLKSKFLRHLKKRVINPLTKKYITKTPSTGDLSTWGFIEYTDAIRQWAIEFLSVNIPDPNKEWKQRAEADFIEALNKGLITKDERNKARIALKLQKI